MFRHLKLGHSLKIIMSYLALIASEISAQSESNIVVNGGFEQTAGNKAAAWNIIDWSPRSNCICQVDRSVFHAGTQSFKITNMDKTKCWLQQAIILKPNTDYVLRAWLKGENIESDSGGCAAVWVFQGGWGWDNCIAKFDNFIGTFDWTDSNLFGNHSVTFRTGMETNCFLCPVLYGPNKGSTVWFDDIIIEEQSLTAKTTNSSPLKAVIQPIDWQEQKVFHMFNNAPNILAFWYLGDKTMIKQPKLIIDLPREFNLVGLVFLLGGRATKWSSGAREEKDACIRYIIPISPSVTQHLTPGGLAWRTADLLCVAPRNCAGRDFEIAWHIENDGIAGPVSKFKTKVLTAPKPAAVQSRFRMEACFIPAP